MPVSESLFCLELPPTMFKAFWKIVLVGAIAAILVIFYLGLSNNPRAIPSPLVGKKAQPFDAEPLVGEQRVRLQDYRGQWLVVNFWGSWCVSCVSEHRDLMQLAAISRQRGDFAIVGVDFRDTRQGAETFLKRHGNPGYAHAFDPKQKIAIDWGVYGAPESYIVSPDGKIAHKHTGPIYPGWFEKVLLPIIEGKESVETVVDGGAG
ncbi:MAG: DsbE family thiol:disulfide interchange protein [Magnetococcales bacterium]|nr:DsbE family thiol:disulfide interchange protein [Magnetococcales bacterium]